MSTSRSAATSPTSFGETFLPIFQNRNLGMCNGFAANLRILAWLRPQWLSPCLSLYAACHDVKRIPRGWVNSLCLVWHRRKKSGEDAVQNCPDASLFGFSEFSGSAVRFSNQIRHVRLRDWGQHAANSAQTRVALRETCTQICPQLKPSNRQLFPLHRTHLGRGRH